MAKKILFTRPCYDLETKYLHCFSDKLIKEIKLIGEYNPINLEDSDVTRENFEKAIRKGNPRLVVLNGHGTKDSIFGHDDEVIVDENNVDLFDSKIVYAAVCDSLGGIGLDATSKGGADAFIGYESEFMIIVDPTHTSTPKKDKNSKPFKEVYVKLIIALLSGLSVEESIEMTKKLMRKLIREYGTYGIRDKYGDAPLIRMALFWDLYFLNAHGNLDVVF
ncbi:MAG: hypothetical protein ISS48_00760 [Candidatus Aenigmarchaeota archaeon]|nr:hypothetical protein [Candidatus Aenigmarchaeota archaeon]